VSDVELRVSDDPGRACAELLAATSGHLVLTGGSTPERSYELAAELRDDWSGVELWWGDERAVPPEHEWSNYGLARRALIDRTSTPPAAVHRIRGELGAARAAELYDEELRGVVPDLTLLGLGPDGHVASLYPHAPALRERERRAIAAEAQLEPFVERVTMTIPVLEAAPLVVFLLAGEAKGAAAARSFGAPPSDAIPGSLVRSRHGQTIVLLDPPAARGLGI
jgi:6-phosphogluconolactonase